MAFIAVAKVDDVAEGKGICVKVSKKSVAIFHVDGNYYALDDYCPHQGAPIANGYLSAKDVTCPWHGASFDLATGKGLSGPCGGGITPYPVRIIGDTIEIDYDESAASPSASTDSGTEDGADEFAIDDYMDI